MRDELDYCTTFQVRAKKIFWLFRGAIKQLVLWSFVNQTKDIYIHIYNIARPVARIFRREVHVCQIVNLRTIYDVNKHARLGGSGGMLPQEDFGN